jgi:ferrous iron transport protein A
VNLHPGDDDAIERTLDLLAPGESATIARLEGNPAIARRLMELGLVPGTIVAMVRSAPFGDPLELTVRGVHLSLRRTEARSIHVAPL